MKQRALFDWVPDAVRAKSGKSGIRPRLLLHERLCKACGQEFRPTRRNQRYCNSTCRKTWGVYGREYQIKHRERLTIQAREWRNKNRPRVLNAHFKREYGITLEEYNRMLAAQGGGCAICGTRDGGSNKGSERLHVDHDHVTGKARGLLCGTCNRGIGQLGDDLERLLAAVRYLQGSRQPMKASESA